MPLERVLEPEVMSVEDEARAYDAMDHESVNAAFVVELLAARPSLDPVLDVGTGTALIPIRLCREARAARVVGIDLADPMLALAARNVERAGLSGIVSLLRADAKALPFAERSFRCVVSNTILHHLPEPLDALREMVRVLRPGGVLFVRDLLRPADERDVDKLVEVYAAGADPLQRALLDASLRASLSLGEVQSRITALGLPRDAVRRTSDRHWTLSWRAPEVTT